MSPVVTHGDQLFSASHLILLPLLSFSHSGKAGWEQNSQGKPSPECPGFSVLDPGVTISPLQNLKYKMLWNLELSLVHCVQEKERHFLRHLPHSITQRVFPEAQAATGCFPGRVVDFAFPLLVALSIHTAISVQSLYDGALDLMCPRPQNSDEKMSPPLTHGTTARPNKVDAFCYYHHH